ncbi:MAG: iron-containing alcohol dehydrogenase [Nitrospinae bacterium]|nr:iron-containing alcohol dehydrogenase [Nitrospinota bacterium]
MQDFIYRNPTQIIFGRGKAAETGAAVAKLGKSVLLVYGKESIKGSGLHARIRQSLAAAGVRAADHGGVKPNPLISHAREGIAKVRAEGLEVVLAVGGGSVMDEAKAIAAGATVDYDPWLFFTGGKRPERALPLVAVPTLAATGSEMNGNSVMTSGGLKLAMYSPHSYPAVSILDPELTMTVPKEQTVYGIVDTFSHIMEPYFGGREMDAPVQDRLAEGLFVALFESANRLLQDPHDYRGRADMLWASAVALCGIAQAGRGPAGWENHMLAHSIGALTDAPHGACLAVVMPGWMSYASLKRPEKFDQFAERVIGMHGAQNGIAQLKMLFSQIGAPVTLARLGLKEEDIPRIVAHVLESSPGGGSLGPSGITAVLKLCL